MFPCSELAYAHVHVHKYTKCICGHKKAFASVCVRIYIHFQWTYTHISYCILPKFAGEVASEHEAITGAKIDTPVSVNLLLNVPRTLQNVITLIHISYIMWKRAIFFSFFQENF